MSNNKQNCWEFNNCAHGPTGAIPLTDGVCSVPFLQKYDGKNHGVNAGRSCWQVMNNLGAITGGGFFSFLSNSFCSEYIPKTEYTLFLTGHPISPKPP